MDNRCNANCNAINLVKIGLVSINKYNLNKGYAITPMMNAINSYRKKNICNVHPASIFNEFDKSNTINTRDIHPGSINKITVHNEHTLELMTAHIIYFNVYMHNKYIYVNMTNHG